MRRATMTTAALSGLLILGLVGCGGGGGGEENKADKDRGQPQKVEPRKKVEPPPADLVESWTNINARIGRLRLDTRAGELVFQDKTIEYPTDLLAIRLDEATEEGLRTVLPPDVPFALILDQAHDGLLTGLARFKNLENLQLLRAGPREVGEGDKKQTQEVTAKGVKAVCTVAGLRALTISESRIGDAPILAIANLQKLKTLALNGCANIGDGACKNLLLARSIESLGLGSTRVTSAGLKALAPLSLLRSLDLSNDTLTSLADLPNPGRLLVLRLKGCKSINNDNLAPVANCKQLQRLDIGYTNVSDAGLKYLSGLKELRTLHTGGLDVTAAALATLRKEIPEVRLAD